MFGELIPFGGGDPIPLTKERLLIGRRESCDIVLRFANVSAHHCELTLERGYWFVKDLGSRNGTKVNGLRATTRKRIDPGDRLSIAKHHYEVKYSPAELGAEGPPPDDAVLSDILGQSLMDSAGLNRRRRQVQEGRIGLGSRPTDEAEAAETDELVELGLEDPEDENGAEAAEEGASGADTGTGESLVADDSEGADESEETTSDTEDRPS